MLVIKLETKISDQGIEYRYFPFHFKFHLIKWEEIRHCEVIEYSPLWDYGGWGIRWSSNGKAYNVSGKTGLQVYMKNGKKILFGTQKRQEMETAVKNAKMA